MRKKPDPEQMLLDLARNEGPDVVHLPYTPEFEAVCQRINPAATIEDKHGVWEKLLALREATPSPAPAAVPSEVAPVSTLPPVPASPPARISGAPQERGLLFEIHEAIPDLQPWSVPHEPALAPEHIERRQKMLAEIGNSYLVAGILIVQVTLIVLPAGRCCKIATHRSGVHQPQTWARSSRPASGLTSSTPTTWSRKSY